MKVFVTGASGFVGEEILQQLHAAKHSIRVLARKPDSPLAKRAALQYGAEIFPGDVTHTGGLANAVRGSDAIVHLVGIIGEVGNSTFENVHVNGTRNITAAASQAGVSRYVHMSALGSRPNAVSRYHQTKWAAEEIVRTSGLDFTIFRPSIVYGSHDHFVNMFARLARFSPVLPVIGDGESKLQPVSVQDVARCFVGALTAPKSIGPTYDLCGHDHISFNQVMDTITEVTRRKRLKIHIPIPLAKLQAAILEFFFAKALRKVPPLSRDQILMLQEDNVGDPKPADEQFDLKQVHFKTGIASYLK